MDEFKSDKKEKINVPIYIQRRQYQLRNYVLETLFPEGERARRVAKMKLKDRKEFYSKMNAIVDECTWVCCLFSLKQFFTEGTKAAIMAVDTFKDFNIDGFNIGNKRFEERNSNVMEGQHLYEELLRNIENEDLKQLIEKSENYYEITSRYKNVSI